MSTPVVSGAGSAALMAAKPARAAGMSPMPVVGSIGSTAASSGSKA